ncbi:MAG: hypothetical protein WC178_05130 [Candidatus Paceibacterota bacterium]
MNNTKVIISSLIILLIVSIGISFVLFQKNKNPKSCDIKSENQETSLINNKYTKDLNEIPDGWKTYQNDEYSFQINYPEEFDGQKIQVTQAEFKNNQELYAQLQENKMPDDVKWMSGYTEMDKKITDFNYLNGNKTTSLFAITIYSNPLNLSLKDFVSDEILNMPEGIDDQKIVNLNGKNGYKIVITKGVIGMPSSVVYYMSAKDGKNIIGISSPIEVFDGGYGPDLRFEDFVKAYQKYNGDLQNIDNVWNIAGNQKEFDKKYPEYKNFIENLSAQSAQKELNKRLTFDQIAYSFNF